MKYHVKSLSSASEGRKKIEWAEKEMPVLRLIRKRFSRQKPLKGIKIGCCLHVTTETANLMLTLKAGGAQVALCASNPLSTQDEVAASLVKDYGISVFSIRGEDNKTYYRHINQVLDILPDLTMDDGADLVSTLHIRRSSLLSRNMPIGGSEETTTGVIRLRAMQKDGKLRYPMVAVNDAMTKHLFDNRYGTGQSTVDGILRSTNILLAGKNAVVCGYGWCGRGLALRLRGMGAHVIVTEVDYICALEATMDGFQVMPMDKAAPIGDIFVTLTGDISVIRKEHFRKMKDGAILSNSGHFDVEIDVKDLRKMAKKNRIIRKNVEEFVLGSGKRIYLLAEGRLVNLSAAEGHPANVMDMSFANQSLCSEYLVRNSGRLEKMVYAVPEVIDREIARLKLASLGIKIDRLSEKQKRYLSSWNLGT